MEIKVRGKERKSVYIPKEVKARWAEGRKLDRSKTIVFDYMPILLGNQFRVDGILSRQLFRDEPVDAPLMLTNEAYRVEGMRQLKRGNIIAALEAYKFALDAQTGFVSLISDLGDAALLTDGEIVNLRLQDNPLEAALVKVVDGKGINQEEYGKWIEEVRSLNKEWFRLNHKAYGSKEYVEMCIRLGRFEEARYGAQKLRSKTLLNQARRAKPKEVLDIEFLQKYVNDNFPESTMGRGA